MKKRKEIQRLARNIKLLILDIDGVLTDGSIILDNQNNEFKKFHVRDGHGIKMLLKAGVKVAFITGRYSMVVRRRAKELGVRDVFQKCYDKRLAYRKLLSKYKLKDEEVAYIGDDIVDIPLLRNCGLPITVSEADKDVKSFAKIITKKQGGRGAVREICDLILKAKGLYQGIINEYITSD
jgi:3-deoxy-D-manno-octulosonate 8-phosphate phosphatase (KDO 8-P phosphatase)